MRAPPVASMWVAWGVYVWVALCGGVLSGASIVVVVGVGLAWPVIAFVAAWLWPRGAPVDAGIATWEAWAAIALAVFLGASPALYSMTRLEAYWLLPIPQLVAGALFGLLPFGMVLVSRWRGASGRERAGWSLATLFVLSTHAAWVSTVGLQVLFALHYPLFEAARLEARDRLGPDTQGWREDVHIGVFTFDAVGQTPSFGGTGAPYFAAEQCPRHDYTAPKGGGTSPRMCFVGAGGVGFYYTDTAAQIPPLNQSAHGRLVGGWRWYVDD